MTKKILADESVDYAIVKRLRENGFEVISVTEKYSGFSDTEVLRMARKYQCLLITEDKDFGELAYRLNRSHFGIFLIRLGNLPRIDRIETTIETLTDHFEKITDRFSVLTHNGLRIKKINVKT